jgi:hypothetical protein
MHEKAISKIARAIVPLSAPAAVLRTHAYRLRSASGSSLSMYKTAVWNFKAGRNLNSRLSRDTRSNRAADALYWRADIHPAATLDN